MGTPPVAYGVLYFDAEADRALTKLEADPTRSTLVRRLNQLLDHLEQYPGDASMRRQRFANGLWYLTVTGNGETWAVLWEPHPEDPGAIIVQYLGPASFA